MLSFKLLVGCGNLVHHRWSQLGDYIGYSTSLIIHLEASLGCESADVLSRGLLSGFTEYWNPQEFLLSSHLIKACSISVGNWKK